MLNFPSLFSRLAPSLRTSGPMWEHSLLHGCILQFLACGAMWTRLYVLHCSIHSRHLGHGPCCPCPQAHCIYSTLGPSPSGPPSPKIYTMGTRKGDILIMYNIMKSLNAKRDIQHSHLNSPANENMNLFAPALPLRHRLQFKMRYTPFCRTAKCNISCSANQ